MDILDAATKKYEGQGWSYHPQEKVWRRWAGRRFFEHWLSKSPKEGCVRVHYRLDDSDDEQGDFDVALEDAGKAFTEKSISYNVKEVVAGASPKNKNLWEKIQRLVKGEIKSFDYKGKKVHGPREGKGFKTFPSAYANQWAAKLYKSLGGKWQAEASFLTRIEAEYSRLVWTPTQVHQKLSEIVPELNKLLPEGVFLQATKEKEDDVPVVRVLLGVNDPYTAERLGSFAFYSTMRGMEWFVRTTNVTTDFKPYQGEVLVTYFCDLQPKDGEVFIGKVSLNDPASSWVEMMRKAPCPALKPLAVLFSPKGSG